MTRNLVLYGLEPSPPVRACKLTLSALNLDYDFKLVNLLASDHKTKDFLRKNPQHTVPTLEDDGKYLWDSHAIMAYLVRKYEDKSNREPSLYPSDYFQRAIVDQRLHFESGILFEGCVRNISLPLFYENKNYVEKYKIEAIYKAYDFLEIFLDTNMYLCGNMLTIADFSCVSSVSSLIEMAIPHQVKHRKLIDWLQRMEQLPYYRQANGNGARMLRDMYKTKITKIV